MLWITLFSYNLAISSTEELTRWQSCHRHNQCIEVASTCETLTSINKKYRYEYELYLEQLIAATTCPPTANPPTKKYLEKATKGPAPRTPKCIKRQCVLK